MNAAFAIVFLACFSSGFAINCYSAVRSFGILEGVTEVLCAGSCMKSIAESFFTKYGCHAKHVEQGCNTEERGLVKIESCFCNSNLCNIPREVSPAASLKCYESQEGSLTETNCDYGSCVKITAGHSGDRITGYGCHDTHMEEGCTTETQHGVSIEFCFCNSNLCNISKEVSPEASLKCYISQEGSLTETNCDGGSCMKITVGHSGNETTGYGCHTTHIKEGCTNETERGVSVESCFCNSNLCNIPKEVSPEASLKCYISQEGSLTETNCDGGSCMKITVGHSGNRTTGYGCHDTHMEEGCTTETQHGVSVEFCFCNSSLCNNPQVVSQSKSLECYKGVEGSLTETLCDGGSCVKMAVDHSGEIVAEYNCHKKLMADGCTSENMEGVVNLSFEICICNTPLCNASRAVTLAYPLLLAVLFLKAVLC